MSCGCGQITISSVLGAPTAAASTLRDPCWQCTAKHLGCAAVALEYSKGYPATVGLLVARAQILMGETLLGYPWHRSLAIGALALAAEALALDSQPSPAADVKATQKAIETNSPVTFPELPAGASLLTVRVTRDVAAAHLAEAAAESPDPKLAGAITSSATLLPRNPAYAPPLETWLRLLASHQNPMEPSPTT